MNRSLSRSGWKSAFIYIRSACKFSGLRYWVAQVADEYQEDAGYKHDVTGSEWGQATVNQSRDGHEERINTMSAQYDKGSKKIDLADLR